MKKKINKEFEDKKDLLHKVIADINKKAGKELIKFAKNELKKELLSTGIDKVDAFIGGIQRGNFSIIYGAERTGKSTLALTFIAKNQSRGLTCAYIDLEHSFDPDRAKGLGINLDTLILIEDAETAEQAMDVVIKLSEQKVVDLIVVDSIQAMSPKQEMLAKAGDTKSVEDESMALLARKLGQFFRMCSTKVYQGNVAVLMIGQARVHGIGTFITKLGLSGGHALKHFSIMTLYMRRGQGADAPFTTVVKDGKKEKLVTGFDCVIEIEKTKVTGSKFEGEKLHIPFYYKTGFKEEEK